MRYTTAIAVATLATGAFAAGHGHGHAHERLHAREAEAEPEAAAEAEPITYSDGQCWGTYGCNAKTGAPAAPAQTQAADATAAAAPAKNTQPAAAPASQASSAAGSIPSAKATGSTASTGGSVDVQSILSGNHGDTIMAAKSDGSCSNDASNPNVMEVSNQSGESFVWTCWGAAGSWVNKNAPILAVGVPSGGKQTVSFKESSGSQGGGCAPLFKDTKMANGQIKETWLEFTFSTDQYANGGTIDVSREVNINGHSISATTACGCKTDMNNCVFVCNDPNGDPSTPGQCGKAGSYTLKNCSGTNMNTYGGNDGGCQAGKGKTSVTVS